MAAETRQARYKRTHPWVRFVEYCRRRTSGKHTNKDTQVRYAGLENTLTSKQAEELWRRDGADSMKKPSLDRIKSKKGYTFENCRFIEFYKNLQLAREGNSVDEDDAPGWVTEAA